MTGASERLAAEFLRWEERGRGYALWLHPVPPEPLFRPFLGHVMGADASVTDDGRKPTRLSSFVRRLSAQLAPPSTEEASDPEDEEETPDAFFRSALVELRAHFEDIGFDRNAWGAFFASVSVAAEPIVFEMVSAHGRISVQFVVSERDERLVSQQLAAFFPDAAFGRTHGLLEEAWGERGEPVAAVEFGLGKEFMIPFASGRADPFVGVVGALSEIEEDETAIFQVIFAPAREPWHESVMRSVTHADGKAFFVNAPELASGAEEKVSRPLFAAVVRVAVKAETHDRMWDMACNVAGALGAYGSRRGNELVPLKNDGYAACEHEEDVLSRQSRRSGMILNADELAGFVHLPSSEVRSLRLQTREGKTKGLPPSLTKRAGLLLGRNVHFGADTPVVLTSDERVRHMHVIGASGTGKSTLLFNLIRQDIENGEGLTLIEPHGDLIDRVLSVIPEHRMDDVVLLDPSDEEYMVGFNVLSAHSDWEKNLLASDLVAVFRRNSTSWGDQLNSVLQNAILAFLESEQGGTLLDLRRFLLEPAFRAEFLKTVRDDNLLYYWRKGFPALTGNKSVGSIVTRLDAFLSPKPLRYMVGQRENRLDFGDIMGSGRILLAKLSQGAIGADNSRLLGSLIVAKIQSEAMSRQRQSEKSRRDHFCYIDEFHDFLTPSLAETLSGARKYRLGLVLAHQEMRQVEKEPEVASALLSNAYTRVVFRVGDRDARTLESGFSTFDSRDLQNLRTCTAVCCVERSDNDFNLSVEPPRYPDEATAGEQRRLSTDSSRRRYATPRAEIENAFVPPVADTPVDMPETERPPVSISAPAPVLPSQVAPEPPPPAEPKLAAPLPDLGRGGAQHKAIQDRIKEEGEKLGFRVTVEKEILDGAGSVDLVLSRDGAAIACEVTVTTTIDHEVGNVAKCLKAGFARVVLIAVSQEKLAKLSAAVGNSLGPEKAACVGYFLPDAFIALLRDSSRVAQASEKTEVRSRGGRLVKRTFTTIGSADANRKENEALSLMGEIMRRKTR